MAEVAGVNFQDETPREAKQPVREDIHEPLAYSLEKQKITEGGWQDIKVLAF